MHLKTLHDLDSSDGTARLRRLNSSFETESTARILVPHPSPNDPNDPLRWPVFKKDVAFSCICVFIFLTNFGVGGLSPAFQVIGRELHRSPAQVTQLITYPVLTLGLSNFIWVPVANVMGKRPVFVGTCLLMFGCYVWQATATSFSSLLWASIIGQFAGASTEALGVALVNDLFFLHERANKVGITTFSIAAGNTIGPLLGGFITETIGWRWLKWLSAILTGVNFVAILLLFPETRYNRDVDACLRAGIAIEELASPEAIPDSPVDSLDHHSQFKDSGRSTHTSHSTFPVQVKSYRAQLALLDKVPPKEAVLSAFLRPFPTIAYPVVLYASIGYALSLAWVLIVNTLNPFILQSPPYSLSPSVTGLINIPGFIGNSIGSFVGGWCLDKWCIHRTRKNDGVFEPEMRLAFLLFPLLFTPAGCLLFGYGAGFQMHWVALFLGYGMMAIGLTSFATITMTYASDSLFPIASDALLLINGLKNIVAFGFSYGALPWVDRDGYINVFGSQAGIYVAIIGGGWLVLGLWGGRIRHWTGNWRIIL